MKYKPSVRCACGRFLVGALNSAHDNNSARETGSGIPHARRVCRVRGIGTRSSRCGDDSTRPTGSIPPGLFSETTMVDLEILLKSAQFARGQRARAQQEGLFARRLRMSIIQGYPQFAHTAKSREKTLVHSRSVGDDRNSGLKILTRTSGRDRWHRRRSRRQDASICSGNVSQATAEMRCMC